MFGGNIGIRFDVIAWWSLGFGPLARWSDGFCELAEVPVGFRTIARYGPEGGRGADLGDARGRSGDVANLCETGWPLLSLLQEPMFNFICFLCLNKSTRRVTMVTMTVTTRTMRRRATMQATTKSSTSLVFLKASGTSEASDIVVNPEPFALNFESASLLSCIM